MSNDTHLKYDEPELDMQPPPITEVVAEYNQFKENQKNQPKQIDVPIPPYKEKIIFPFCVDLVFHIINNLLISLLIFIIANILLISNVIQVSISFLIIFIGVLLFNYIVKISGLFFIDTRPETDYIPDQIKTTVVHIVIFAIMYGLIYLIN